MITTVRVPASSANLGPGFDALGLALNLYLVCRLLLEKKKSITIAVLNKNCISSGEDNLIWQTALTVAKDTDGVLPPIDLEIDNQIPLGKGLGYSAAALTAG